MSLRWLTFLLLLSGLAQTTACSGVPRGPMTPNALSSFVVWSPVALVAGTTARGEAVDVLAVRGGEIVRLLAAGDGAVEVGERARSGDNSVESWSAYAPREGSVVVRPGAFATALLLRKGAIAHAYRGHGSDPGYAWFELEDRVTAWAEGPLPAPFPEVAPRARLDYAGFAELDRALASAVAAARTPATALEAARAVRTVAGLRALRALRPPSGFPYFLDTALLTGTAPDPSAVVAPDRPYPLTVTGPRLLHVWARREGSSEGTAELRVLEGGRLRGEAELMPPRSPLTSQDPEVFDRTSRAFVRRAIVHVPPGRHTYRFESTSPLRIVPLLAEPVVHLEDARAKDEEAALRRALRACGDEGAAAICAFTLALLGADDDRGSRGNGPWSRALARSPEATRALAEVLAAGGPREPVLRLGRAASRGDAEALAALSGMVSESVDEVTRSTWAQAMSIGSEWRAVDADSSAPLWTSVSARAGRSPLDAIHASPPASVDPSTKMVDSCPAQGTAMLAEVGAAEADYIAATWHGAPVLELVVLAACDDQRPVELVVDGERLVVHPSDRLVRWHVRVRGTVARVRRDDDSRARILALPARLAPCEPRIESVSAPAVAASVPELGFGGARATPGLELWLRDGARFAGVRVESASGPANGSMSVSASRSAGQSAYDAAGARWTRVARVALPTWAAGGVRIRGNAEVAVRALVRVPRLGRREPASPPVAETAAAPLDESTLVDLTRRILEAAETERGPLFLRRGVLLAKGGALSGALADARAAARFGARGPNGEAPDAIVRAAWRRHPSATDPMPDTLRAYGIEADFDAESRTCARHDGGRAKLEGEIARAASLRTEASGRIFDPVAAARAVAAQQESPWDPRGARLVARAFEGSRWKLRRDVGNRERHVRRPRSPHTEDPVSGDGELRPRVLTGRRFEPGTYATVLPARPAEAVLDGLPPKSVVRVEIACASREPSKAVESRCPILVSSGGVSLRPEVGADGQGSAVLPISGRSGERISVALSDGPGEWVALVRLVVDRPVPGALRTADGRWVLAPAPTELRTLVAAGEEMSVDSGSAAILRIDALREGDAPAVLSLVEHGHERTVAVDGTPAVVALPEGGKVLLRVRGGNLSIAVAERVPLDGAREEGAIPPASPPLEPTTRDVLGPVTFDGATQDAWRTTAWDSPDPLTPLQESMGTWVVETGAVYGTLRQNWVVSSEPDGFAFTSVGYRRRVESMGLWTRADAFTRVRNGEPTYGATGVLYEELERLRLRLSGTVSVEAQQIAGIASRSVLARGFAEYSARALSNVFVLPRVGYDGVYSSLPSRPTRLAYVDDEVYNPYRSSRPTLLFVQLLGWYTPYFNEIWFLRLRTTLDPRRGVMSHASVRPGAFVAFGDLDLSAFFETVWYPPSDSPAGTAHLSETFAASASYLAWSGLGSFGVQPGIAAAARVEQGWQLTMFVNILASYRRGLRDFSSLELDFPEQLGGRIPWRGDTRGGYR